MNSKPVTTGLTADDIAAIWNLSKGTVYRYAHEHGWRRYTHASRAYYHPDDVMATFDDQADEEH